MQRGVIWFNSILDFDFEGYFIFIYVINTASGVFTEEGFLGCRIIPHCIADDLCQFIDIFLGKATFLFILADSEHFRSKLW